MRVRLRPARATGLALRCCVLTALVLFTAVAPAQAAPRALTRSSDLLAFAAAGEQVLVARVHGTNLRVFAIPLTGGVGRQVFSFDAPSGLRPERAALAASAQRAALTIEMGEGRGEIDAVQTFAGPVTGGWSELQPFTTLGSPEAVSLLRQQVDGERIFTTESRRDDVRVVVRDPDPHELAFASDENVATATFAGDLVAFAKSGGDQDSNVLVVRDWRTGAVVSSADLQDGFNSIALRPDGRAAVTTYEGALYEVRPGAPPRLLTRQGGSAAAYAGDSLVYDPGERLRLIDASGRIRRLGAPTWSLGGFATDGSRALWVANGCLLVDDVSAPPAAAPGPGPCLRSEIALDARRANPYLAHTLPVRLRCVAAPRACRGALRLTTIFPPADAVAISRRVRFSIPAGHARRLQVPLTCLGYRTMRRTLARESRASVRLDARSDDGDRFPVDLSYEVSSGPAEVTRRCGLPVAPTRLPASVDVGPLRGKALPGTPCTFRRKLEYGNPGDGNVRIWLDCARAHDVGRLGFVQVERVQTGREIPEDSRRCQAERDRDPSVPPLHACDLWHGKITIHTRAWCARRCNAEKEAGASEAARATMARVVERLAALPEATTSCASFARVLSPAAVAWPCAVAAPAYFWISA